MIFHSDIFIQKLTDLCSAVIQYGIYLVFKGLYNCLSWLVNNELFIILLGVLKDLIELQLSLYSFLLDFAH